MGYFVGIVFHLLFSSVTCSSSVDMIDWERDSQVHVHVQARKERRNWSISIPNLARDGQE